MNEQIEFNYEGILLRGRYTWPEKEPVGRMPLVIMATGDGRKGSKSGTWSYLSDKLRDVGLASFIFDFQGLGYSDGVMAELNLTIGVENLRLAISAAKSHRWIDASRIGLLGSSFGGNAALIYTAQHSGVKALGLKSPVSFYPEVCELLAGDEGMVNWKRTGYFEDAHV